MHAASFVPCLALLSLVACGGGDDLGETASGARTSEAAPGTSPTTAGGDPGPKPSRTCATKPDARGFFELKSPKGSSWIHLPTGYANDAPVRAVLGLHGCGDSAESFLEWAVSPPEGREGQGYVAISVDGATKSGNCWDATKDVAVALEALDDASSCFWIDRRKVTVAGYSSGGILAYALALGHADRFAGLLVENSGAYGVPGGLDAAVAAASRKLPIAHHASTGDSAFPLAKVRASWQTLRAAGFDVTSDEGPGDHDGRSSTWSAFLHPKAERWVRPAP